MCNWQAVIRNAIQDLIRDLGHACVNSLSRKTSHDAIASSKENTTLLGSLVAKTTAHFGGEKTITCVCLNYSRKVILVVNCSGFGVCTNALNLGA